MLPYNTASAASNKNGGGILRKTNTNVLSNNLAARKELHQQLLVFGYASKIFRDDAKAIEIDKGKHLIPWMGDTSLKIDRYDVRGALSDLTPYEPPPGGYGNRLDYLTAEEQRAEQLCEEERYFFLYNNEQEHILQQEEDLKRLQQEVLGNSYGRVGFQYDCPQHGPNMNEDEQQNSISNGVDESEQPYVMPKNLQVPISIQMPDTMKQHAIIEKTARFIATQGIQMEILLKAKQSNNVQFEFLSQNGILNPYYKLVLNAIKNGTYPLEELPNNNDNSPPNEETTKNQINIIQQAKPIITVPTIKYKPSANCAYTQLISKIKGVPLPEFLNEDANGTAEVEEDSPKTPTLLQCNEHTYVQAGATATEEGDRNSNSNSNSNATNPQESQVEILKNSSALALAQNYSSDSETDEEDEKNKLSKKPEPVLNFPIPDENLRNIIDKTATYVVKNGRQFEETLRSKSEDRFTFLMPENGFYPYYMYKVTGDPDAASKEQKTRRAAAVAAALLSKKGITTPVSFSIRGIDQTTSKLVLPQEPSDDDDDENKKKSEGNSTTTNHQQRSVPENVQKAIQLVESQLMARNAQFASVNTNTNNPVTSPNQISSNSSSRSRFDLDYSAGSSSKRQIKSSKTELERNAIYEAQQQSRQKQLKKAEEKVKDKLAQIAREKLGGMISKDKQLQLERKRKAMAFLNQIKGSSSNQEGSLSSELRNEDQKDENGNLSDSCSDISVHSIPITSYGPGDDEDHEDKNQFPDKKKTRTDIAASSDKIEKNSKRVETTVLLSDDDDVELISEQKPNPTLKAIDRLHHHREERKRNYASYLKQRNEVKRQKNKPSPESDASSFSSSDKILKYESYHQRHSHHNYHYNNKNSNHDEELYSSTHKSLKKSKKSSKSSKLSKSKKKKKKSSSRKDRSPSTFSQVSRRSKHSHSRHRTPSEYEVDSDESGTTTESQRYKLSLYELDERVTYTPPASPSRRSSRTYKSSSSRHKESRRSYYDI